VAGSGGKGVVVTGVDPEGSAVEHGYRSGDVIVELAAKRSGTRATCVKRGAPVEINWRDLRHH